MSDSNFSLPLENSGDDFSVLADFMKNGQSSPDTIPPEGQLSVDVAQTDNAVIVIAPMAGCRAENLELHLHNDVLTIRGERQIALEPGAEYFYRECYWGKFSRTIVLPVEIKAEMTQAEFKNGVLRIVLPKANTTGSIPIVIVEE
jgi:HSP20 family protein